MYRHLKVPRTYIFLENTRKLFFSQDIPSHVCSTFSSAFCYAVYTRIFLFSLDLCFIYSHVVLCGHKFLQVFLQDTFSTLYTFRGEKIRVVQDSRKCRSTSSRRTILNPQNEHISHSKIIRTFENPSITFF